MKKICSIRCISLKYKWQSGQSTRNEERIKNNKKKYSHDGKQSSNGEANQTTQKKTNAQYGITSSAKSESIAADLWTVHLEIFVAAMLGEKVEKPRIAS